MQIGKYNLINLIKTIDLELTQSSIYTIKNRGGKKWKSKQNMEEYLDKVNQM